MLCSMGILAFGLSTPRNLAIATGIVVAFFGCLICLGNLWVSGTFHSYGCIPSMCAAYKCILQRLISVAGCEI